jgi:hypothetical protein
MTDPPRLLDATEDPFERMLLGSAQRDRGSHAAQARCGAAIAAAGVIATKSVAAATATSATAAAAATPLVGAGMLVKAVAIGLAVGLGAQGTYVVADQVLSPKRAATARRVEQPRAVENQGRAREATPPLPAESPPVEVPAVTEEPRVAQAPAQATSTALPSQARAAPPASQPSGTADDSLEREVLLLDEARRAYRVAAYGEALRLLGRHASEFPAGALGPEATMIEVQALLGLGRRSDAEAIAQKHIAFHPNSAVAQRLKMLLGWTTK